MTTFVEGRQSPWSTLVDVHTALPRMTRIGPAQGQLNLPTGYVTVRRTMDLVGLLEVGTSSGVPRPDGEPRSYARSLRAIQDRSGLDWGRIAATLGVSRRSVHLWLNGGAVSGVNGQCIALFYRLVLQSIAGNHADREQRRRFLLSPGSDGRTPLANMARNIRAAHSRPRPVLSAAESLETPRVVPDPAHGTLDNSVQVVALADGESGY